jgi:PTH1 family peptidyl-tRNA hydrolase
MPHPFRLIVGLGNPGREYAGTRHNIGFDVLDAVAAAEGEAFREEGKWGAAVARVEGAILCKPMRFMNLSGGPARTVADFFKIAPGETLVVLDDSALPLGRIRLREAGTAGGHNGLDSILSAFGTLGVPRLRIGIGGASRGDLSDHVLSRFEPGEKAAVARAVARAVEAMRVAREEGLTAAMNQFNKNEETTP